MVDWKFRDGKPISVLEDLKDPWSEGDGPGDKFDWNLSTRKEREIPLFGLIGLGRCLRK